jgi:hypothetical protein
MGRHSEEGRPRYCILVRLRCFQLTVAVAVNEKLAAVQRGDFVITNRFTVHLKLLALPVTFTLSLLDDVPSGIFDDEGVTSRG